MDVFSKIKKEYIIIVGCGRLGSSIASLMSDQNKNVAIIDINEKSFRKLPVSYGGFTIVGDGSDLDVLSSINASNADILVAATNNDDTNIMVSQIAKQVLGIKKVIVRIKDDSKQIAYADTDIKSIFPSKLSILEFERIINSYNIIKEDEQ